MLNKRFKIAKCKTSLKLATSRIKLMKNKKGIQINQMKKELAQLLESGQDRTARIRVEHVIREEKMVAAYDLVEIYCELIVARLPIIESQKTCPIDLKEAITSVIFSAPRCSDIPELLDVRKQFTAKYGKEFVSAAIELRPDCGVSRMLVEKLSAIAPDVQTKMKVLTAVAKEHNINWDPTSFEEKESKPPDDLLNGPANFEKISTINVDPPKIQTPNVQNVPIHEENPNAPFNFSEQNRRYTLDTQKSSASTTREDMRSSGMTSETMNMRQSFNRNHYDSSSGRENWNMEFKDATSAAQAAAESAERASMAARAAAHLSSQGKITRQYSTESYDSHIRHERTQVSSTSEFPDQHHFKDSYNRSFNDRNPKLQTQEMSPKATERFSRPTSLRSRNDSVKGSLVNNFHQPDGYFENSLNEDQGPSSPEMSRKKESKAGFMSGDNGGFKSANVDHFTEKVIRKQPSITSSRSHSSAVSDDLDVLTSDQKRVGKKTVVDQGNLFRESKKTSSYGDGRKDDETYSDDDDDDDDGGPRFDTGFEYNVGEVKSKFSSSENTHFWNPRRNTTDVMDSAKSVDPSVNFDLSDGPDSESEMAKKFTSPPKQGHKKPPIELYDLIESGSSVSKAEDDDKSLQSRHSSRISRRQDSKKKNQESQLVEDNSFLNQSDDLDTGNGLKFGTLTGGLRNKGGLKLPPYTKTATTPSSPSSNKLVKEIPMKTDQNSFNSRTSRSENKKPKVYISSYESDSDDYSDKFPVQSSKTRSQFTPPDAFFNDDSEEAAPPVPKLTSSSKIHLGSALSRRTKGYVEPVARTVISSSTESYAENSKKDPDRTPKLSEKSSNESERKSSRLSYRNKQETFKKIPEPKISEPPPNPPRKIAESGKTEASKSSNPGCETSVEATNNVKKPSHVHPKLPEYDSLAARIQALRMDHQ
ncbi:rho GTPase-activating protein gacZ-like [Cynara cardunculus var. scolymus]|nr:rho GTPase-activating protein gacZ-like [Cynara cardunculus var. scolymus]